MRVSLLSTVVSHNVVCLGHYCSVIIVIYVIYINEIYKSSEIRLFVDDTTRSTLIANKNLYVLQQVVNSELGGVPQSLLANKLSLIVSK